MKQNKYPQDQMPGGEPRQMTPATSDSQENNFATAPDEVARRAYFSYVNQGSPQGHEVQHWLAAEAELLAERNLTRAHGFHHKA
jgi:hypothetical protein